MRKGETDSERDRDRWRGKELETVRTETRADTCRETNTEIETCTKRDSERRKEREGQ